MFKKILDYFAWSKREYYKTLTVKENGLKVCDYEIYKKTRLRDNLVKYKRVRV